MTQGEMIDYVIELSNREGITLINVGFTRGIDFHWRMGDWSILNGPFPDDLLHHPKHALEKLVRMAAQDFRDRGLLNRV